MKKIIFLFLLALVAPLSSGVFAQTGQTNEAIVESTPTVNPEIKEKVEERIQKVVNDEQGSKKAFVGEITDINSTIQVETKNGEKQIQLNDEAIILDAKKTEIEVQDLEIGDYIIAMGYLQDSGLLDTWRVLVTKEPEPITLSAIVGEVTDKSNDEEIMTVKRFKKEAVWEIEITSKTKIFKKTDSEPEEIKFEDIEQGDRVVAIGEVDEDGDFLTATVIQIISDQTGSDEEEAEPSPTPEAASEEE